MKSSILILALAVSTYATPLMAKVEPITPQSTPIEQTKAPEFYDPSQWRQMLHALSGMPWSHFRTRILREGVKLPESRYFYILSSFEGNALYPNQEYWLLFVTVLDDISIYSHWKHIYYPNITSLAEVVGKFMKRYPDYWVYIRRGVVILGKKGGAKTKVTEAAFRELDPIRLKPGSEDPNIW